MRILHTSDWHFGKHLENRSRILEQELFVDELAAIADREKADLILVAGDIYDTYNPSAEAEQLCYKALLLLSKNGSRPIVLIPGNHDSPERIAAPATLAARSGIFIIDSQKTLIESQTFEKFSVSGKMGASIEITIGDETAIIACVPFPSEKRLSEVFEGEVTEEGLQKTYSEKVGEIFGRLSEPYRDDTINLAMGHFFVSGGELSGSEREIQLGGSYSVDPSALPAKAQYIALGHLHRPQKAAGVSNAYYSGSPVQYSKSETGYAKCVYMVEAHVGKEPVIDKIHLSNYKPVEVWPFKSIEEAIAACEKRAGENTWVFIEIETDRPLKPSEIRAMKTAKDDIVEIRPIYDKAEKVSREKEAEKTIAEEFIGFYTKQKGVGPGEETLKLFLALCGEAGYETAEA
jgi:exonuclease SbcD